MPLTEKRQQEIEALADACQQDPKTAPLADVLRELLSEIPLLTEAFFVHGSPNEFVGLSEERED